MNQQSKYFWKLMNKYGLNRTGNFFHWLDKYGEVQVCDYNRVIYWFEKNMKAIRKEQKDFPEEMPGSIQKHHNKYALRFFKHHFNPNKHNLYLYFYELSIGYMSFHTMTKYDVYKLENKMREYARKHINKKLRLGKRHNYNYSVIKHLPKYVKAELSQSEQYTYPTKTGKPHRISYKYIPKKHKYYQKLPPRMKKLFKTGK